jgi:ComF family protein
MVRSLAPYEGLAGTWIKMLKYGRKKPLGAALGQILASHLRSNEALAPMREADWVVPVPVHRFGRWRRGFNQSELIVRSMCEQLGMKNGERILRKVRNNPKQVGLSYRQRQENVRGAFQATDPAEVKGKRILVVDDIMTTGATLSECARVLKRAGALKVYGLTIARQI